MLQSADVVQRLREKASETARQLVITPQPDLDQLERSGAASVDLRLGTWFVSPRPRRTEVLDVYHQPRPDYSEEKLTKTSYVPFESKFILHPRSFVLASTLEWLRLPNDLGAYVVGRSSWGRRGLIIATATGVHPRFTGCLTLELANVGEIPIAVHPGMQICQIFFHVTSSPASVPEQSMYVGHTRPVLGSLEPDDIARRLKDYQP
jgi:dCTP deaminase